MIFDRARFEPLLLSFMIRNSLGVGRRGRELRRLDENLCASRLCIAGHHVFYAEVDGMSRAFVKEDVDPPERSRVLVPRPDYRRVQ